MTIEMLDPQTLLESLGNREVVLLTLDKYQELVKKAEGLAQERYSPIYVFRDMLADIPEVEAVLANHANGVYSIWTVVDEPSADVRAKIYEKEWQLMEQYPQFGFSFHILEREGEELGNLVSLDDFELNLSLARK
jgi:hypothetical protein